MVQLESLGRLSGYCVYMSLCLLTLSRKAVKSTVEALLYFYESDYLVPYQHLVRNNSGDAFISCKSEITWHL